MADDQIRQLGFDGWAKDFLSGPDPVIAMLCSDRNLHSTPIAAKDISDDVFARLANSPLSSWVSGRNSYQITRRREYGPDAKSTRVAQVKPAKVWTSQPVDQSLKREYQENITQWEGERQSINIKLEGEKSLLLRLREDLEKTMQETVCDAPLTLFPPLTYLSCRKKSRMIKTQNKPRTLSTEPFRKRSVCQISTCSSVANLSNNIQPSKKPSLRVSHRCLMVCDIESVTSALNRMILHWKRLRLLFNTP